ncbi:MAG: TolC family protein [Planctomycetaceae bacterium]
MPQLVDNSSPGSRAVGRFDRPSGRVRRALVRSVTVIIAGSLLLAVVFRLTSPTQLTAAPESVRSGPSGIRLQAPDFGASTSRTSEQSWSGTPTSTVNSSLTIAPVQNHRGPQTTSAAARREHSTGSHAATGSPIRIVSQSRTVAPPLPHSNDPQYWSPWSVMPTETGPSEFKARPHQVPVDKWSVLPEDALPTEAPTTPRRSEQVRPEPLPVPMSETQLEFQLTPETSVRMPTPHSQLQLTIPGNSMPENQPQSPQTTQPPVVQPPQRAIRTPPVPMSENTNQEELRSPADVRVDPIYGLPSQFDSTPSPIQPLQPQPQLERSLPQPQHGTGPSSAKAGQATPEPFSAPPLSLPSMSIPDHSETAPQIPGPEADNRQTDNQQTDDRHREIDQPDTPSTEQRPPLFLPPTETLPDVQLPNSPPPQFDTVPPHGYYGHSFMDQNFEHDSFANDMLPGEILTTPEFSPAMPGHAFLQNAPMSAPYPGTSGYRATVECDAPGWMSPYNQRASVPTPEQTLAMVCNLPQVPFNFVPWWDEAVRQSTGLSDTVVPVNVPMLLQDAMRFSPQVIAIQAEPEVQYRVITQEAAKFDWTAFLNTKYDDLNDPVGNSLTTGNNSDRLLVNKFRNTGGIRGKNLLGGEFRLAQQIGTESQNSRFFIPNNQGQSRLELSYRQPLLDGAGRTYNESEIILARIQANSSEDEVVRALQDHLIEITEAYWALYRARAEFFQRQKLLTAARNVLDRLEARTQVDTIPRQVLRAQAAVARAQTRIQRTQARVKDAEAQLRLLVNSPAMLNGGPTELLPLEAPNMVTETADLQSVLQTSLINRPDISEAIRKMRASSVRLGVSRQELLPRLDFLVESYVADLSGNRNIGQALQGQFGNNRPGYTVGLEFEVPLENRAAIAKNEQRQWELKRSINVFRATVEKSLTDVEIARREVSTAWSEVNSHYHALQAAVQESDYLMDRFTVLPASEDSATLLLEDLLDSIERVADEESAFVQAQVDHAISLVKLKKETGILLQSRHAPPTIQSPDQQWLDDRLQTAVDPSQRMAPNPALPAGHSSQSQPIPRAAGQISTAGLIDPEQLVRGSTITGSGGGQVPSRIRPASGSRPGRPLTDQDPPRGIPVADYPTTWAQPGRSSATK